MKVESFSHGISAGKGTMLVVVCGITVCGDWSEKLQVSVFERYSN
jgi:hypothetical protein